jgi:para-aminobenzoate synthetase component 1
LHLKKEELPVPLVELKQKALRWAVAYQQVAFFEPNQLPYPFGGFLNLLAVSNESPVPLAPGQHFVGLRQALHRQESLLCGLLTYDLKNEIEELSSQHPDLIGFPPMCFFAPEAYLVFEQEAVRLYSRTGEEAAILRAILATNSHQAALKQKIDLQQRISKKEYLKTVEKIRRDIEEGQVYELNYCLEFFAKKVQLNPLETFLALNAASPMPFASLFKHQDRYLLCASPERFLKKEQDKLITQPIKGTIRRGATPAEDRLLQEQLRRNEKERAENMMIVDLARNDLRRSCRTGTIQVEELFGVYGFRHVSQMISTVTGRLRPECDLVDALQGAFPMGSMTGAPKIKAMQLIEQYERARRGLFSGSIGYILPNGDADFNVVIRSLQYNAATGYLSFMVGSAITYDSDPAREYEECLLKARAILQVLGQAS